MAYDIFLYKSKTKISLLSDVKQLKIFEDGIRGGLSFASERFTDTHKSGKTMFHWVRRFFQYKNNTSNMKYLLNIVQDVNNLYGGSQAEALPTSNFWWHPNPEQFMDPDFIKKLTPEHDRF